MVIAKYKNYILDNGAAKKLLLIFLWLFLISSCASYTQQTQEIRETYNSNNFKVAFEKLEASALKNQDRNRLLYFLEKAMILDRLDEKKTSRKSFIDADLLADELFTVSVSKEALTYIYNESAQDYRGEDYEVVAIHTMLSLSFIEDDDLSAALVEARKINNKLAEINSRYGDRKNRYDDDAFARYLSAIVYESKNELDSAIIDYSKALDTYEKSYRREFATAAPKALVKALYRLLILRSRKDKAGDIEKKYPEIAEEVKSELKTKKDFGEIVVIHELGTIAKKVAREFIIPVPNQVLRISFPVIDRSGFIFGGKTGIQINEGSEESVIRAEISQNMDEIAFKTLEDRRLRLILKQTARLAAKGVLTEQAYRNFGPVAGIAANVYSAVTETADTRSWTLLPSAFYVSRVKLAPGKYNLRIYSSGKTSNLTSVEVKPHSIKIIRDKG